MSEFTSMLFMALFFLVGMAWLGLVAWAIGRTRRSRQREQRQQKALRQLVEGFRWKARLYRGEFEPATGLVSQLSAADVFKHCAEDLEAVLDAEGS